MANICFESFEEKFNELSTNEKVAIFNNHCFNQNDPDSAFSEFDDEFFENSFSSKIDVARAIHFGTISSWNDEYIRFNGYGNLESYNEIQVLEEISDNIESIYNDEESWRDFIDDDNDYVCPECGHVFEQGEWDFNYDSALLDFVCPECGWSGNENMIQESEE